MTEMRRVDKTSMRQRGRELRALLNEWDPIGVMGDDSSPADTEYDDLLWPLMRLLEDDAPVSALADSLFHKLDEDYGLDPNRHEITAVAARVKDWFETKWANTKA
jgi:hypothetical protein